MCIPFFRGLAYGLGFSACLWLLIFWAACAALPASVKDARDVQAGVGNVAAKIENMETRVIGLQKEIQTNTYKRINNAGIKDSTLVTLGIATLATVAGGVWVLLRHDERIKQALCRYRADSVAP